MAYIEEKMETSKKGVKISVKVPSCRGGADRNIYVNGSSSGYYLGNQNDKVYRSGREVADSLRDFIRLQYGGIYLLKIKNRGCNFAISFLLDF